MSATPLAMVLSLAEPLSAPEAVYAAPVLIAALPDYLMTAEAARTAGHRTYSWWGLRAHVWLHRGGAAPAVVRHFGKPPEPGRHQRG